MAHVSNSQNQILRRLRPQTPQCRRRWGKEHWHYQSNAKRTSSGAHESQGALIPICFYTFNSFTPNKRLLHFTVNPDYVLTRASRHYLNALCETQKVCVHVCGKRETYSVILELHHYINLRYAGKIRNTQINEVVFGTLVSMTTLLLKTIPG